MQNSPVPVNVRRAEGERVVDERGIDHDAALGPAQQVHEVVEVAVASPHAVPRAVLVQHEDLPRREPALRINEFKQREGYACDARCEQPNVPASRTGR